MAIPFWDPLPSVFEGPEKGLATDPWDVVVIGGKQLPGVCTVKASRALAVDKKKANGVDGAVITVGGYLPGPVEIECLLWTPAMLEALEAILPEIWRPPNKDSKGQSKEKKGLPISHPALALLKIHDVVVVGVSVPEDGKVQGTKIIKIKCVEFIAPDPKSKTGTIRGSGNIVPIAPQYDQSRNRPGDPPSKTDIQPGGPPASKKGGVS